MEIQDETDITMSNGAIVEDVKQIKNTDITSRNAPKVTTFDKKEGNKPVKQSNEVKQASEVKEVVLKRSDILKMYRGRKCAMSNTLPCTLEMCSLMKCDRVIALEAASSNVKKPVVQNAWKGAFPKNLAVNQNRSKLPSSTAIRAANALDRLNKK